MNLIEFPFRIKDLISINAKLRTYITKIDLFYYFFYVILLISHFSSFNLLLIALLYLALCNIDTCCYGNLMPPIFLSSVLRMVVPTVSFVHSRFNVQQVATLFSPAGCVQFLYKPVLFNLSCYGYG